MTNEELEVMSREMDRKAIRNKLLSEYGEEIENLVRRIRRANSYEYDYWVDDLINLLGSCINPLSVNHPIGYLVERAVTPGYRVCCNKCSRDFLINPTCPIYETNIFPYWQTCFNCHSLLVIGKTKEWPELFT